MNNKKLNNKKMLDRVHSNIEKLIDNYADFSETKNAEKKFWDYAKKNILKCNRKVKERELEGLFYDVAYFNEKQGFIYGFNYALEMMGKLDMISEQE